VGSLTSHNPIGLHGLLRDSFTSFLLYDLRQGPANPESQPPPPGPLSQAAASNSHNAFTSTLTLSETLWLPLSVNSLPPLLSPPTPSLTVPSHVRLFPCKRLRGAVLKHSKLPFSGVTVEMSLLTHDCCNGINGSTVWDTQPREEHRTHHLIA
jgi:hypothetical protein